MDRSQQSSWPARLLMHTEHLSGGVRMVEISRCGRAGAFGDESSMATDEVQASGNSSRPTGGGAWARRVGSGSARNPRCSRIFLATSGSSMQAMSRIGSTTTRTLQDIDPQGTLRAPPKTRFSSAAQSRRYVDGTDVDFGDAAGDDGDVGDTCGEACGSAPSLVDAGRGTTLSRRRLVGAKTPCRAFIHHLAVMNRLRFAYVGGIRGTSFSSNSTPVITSCLRPSGSGRFMSYAKRPSSSSLKRDDATAPRAP